MRSFLSNIKRIQYRALVPLLLFILACSVKWFYLAQQSYYVIIHGEYPYACHRIFHDNILDIFKLYFCDLSWTLNARGPLSYVIWVISYKLTNANPVDALYVGILIASLLIPLYYLILSEFLTREVAFFSSIILIFLPEYVEQSIPTTEIILGLVFLLLSLLLTIRYYRNKTPWRLYLSGVFLVMSTLCRYENMLFTPFFVFYNFVFDKETNTFIRSGYWITCFSSILWILFGNLKLTGHAFALMDFHAQFAMQNEGLRPMNFLLAFFETCKTLNQLLPWPLWIFGAAGIFVTLEKYGKEKTLFFIISILVFFAFMLYKIKNGSLHSDERYFLLCAFLPIPLVFELTQAISLKLSHKQLTHMLFIVAIIIPVAWRFHHSNLRWEYFKFPREFIDITKDLKEIPKENPLYIYSDHHDHPIESRIARSILYYLKREMILHSFSDINTASVKDTAKVIGRLKSEPSYFFLIAKDMLPRIEAIEQNKNWTLVKEYNDINLYKIEATRNDSF